MTPEQINRALASYGASVTPEGYIQKGDKLRGVKIVSKGKRLRFEGAISLLASGPATEKFVCDFVEKFWYWEKT